MTADDPATADIRDSVRALCTRFPGAYWRELDRSRGYPTQFVAELTAAGFLAALIPEEYGGSGLGLSAAAAVLEEIHASGGNGGACHAQMYMMGTLLRHGSGAQKRSWLPQIARGESGCRRSVSPNRAAAAIPWRCGPRRFPMVITTSSTARRSGPRVPSIRI